MGVFRPRGNTILLPPPCASTRVTRSESCWRRSRRTGAQAFPCVDWIGDESPRSPLTCFGAGLKHLNERAARNIIHANEVRFLPHLLHEFFGLRVIGDTQHGYPQDKWQHMAVESAAHHELASGHLLQQIPMAEGLGIGYPIFIEAGFEGRTFSNSREAVRSSAIRCDFSRTRS
jgi:hypothetical protein